MAVEYTAGFAQMLDNGMHTAAYHVADPEGSQTETGNGENQADHRETLVPSGIGELEVMLVGARAVKNFSDKAENVDSGNNDRSTSDDGHHGVERAGVFKRSDKNRHLGDETRKTGQTEVGQTGDNVADGQERHDAHQAGEFTYVASVRAAVDETDEGEEEGRHQTVRKHLQHSAGAGGFGHHAEGEEHQAAVRHRRVGVDVLQVGLHASGEGAVDHGDSRQHEEDPAQFVGGLGQEVHGNAETAVTTELHEHTGVEHRNGRGGGGVTIGRPCVEGEECAEHTEADEGHREPKQLPVVGNGVRAAGVVGDLDDVHRVTAGAVEDAEDTTHQEGRTTHEHEGELHRGVFFSTGSPHADEEIHGNERDFIEHEHGEHVNRDEKAEHAHRKQGEPKEIFLGEGLQLPRSKRTGEDDDGREEQHGYTDAVDADRIVNMERGKPLYAVDKEHFAVGIERTSVQEGEHQIDGCGQQGGASCHHHAAHLVETARKPKRRQHQQRDEYEYRKKIHIGVGLLENHDEEDEECAQGEYQRVGLNTSVLQTTDAQRQAVRTPSEEIEETVDDVTIEPGNGTRDVTENDAVRDELVDFVEIETLISPTVQTRERCFEFVGHRLRFTHIDIRCQTDAEQGDHTAGDGDLRVEMDVIGGAFG